MAIRDKFLSSVVLRILFAAICMYSVAHSARYDEDAWTGTGTGRFDTGGLSRETFPKGFVFGTASSAFQVEGMTDKDGRGPSIWDAFVKVPGHITNNDTADVADDQYHRYKEDVDIMANLNFDAYRFSISWTRIFPDGVGKVNWKGVAYYNRLIDYLVEKGISPYATLFHSDFPEALQKKYNGFLSSKVVKDYADYADLCFKTFGDRVKNWFTLNEPRLVAAYGFDTGISPPSRCSKAIGNCTAGNSATEPYIVAHNLILCHASTVKRYREKYNKKQGGKIGIAFDVSWFEPLTRSKADNYAAQRALDFSLGWFLHPLTYGEYPRTMQEIVRERLPKFTKEDVKMVNGSLDFVGINHYTTTYVYNNQHKKKSNVTAYQEDWGVGLANERRGVPVGPRANSFWLYIVPNGMYKTVTYVKERYGVNMVISENGMDDAGNVMFHKGLNDTKRIKYYKDYLTQLKKAIDDGANVTAYFAWSLLDNFEWSAGYTSRFGIVYVDFDNNLKRYPKMSAYWFKQLLTRKKHSK